VRDERDERDERTGVDVPTAMRRASGWPRWRPRTALVELQPEQIELLRGIVARRDVSVPDATA